MGVFDVAELRFLEKLLNLSQIVPTTVFPMEPVLSPFCGYIQTGPYFGLRKTCLRLVLRFAFRVTLRKA